MFVTTCTVGKERMTADEAHNKLILESNNNKDNNASGNNSISQLRAITGLCNAGQFDSATMRLPLHERIIHGDATDQAILRFSESLGEVAELRRCWQVKYELAFNSKNKYMIKAFGLGHPDGLNMALPHHLAGVFEPSDM